MERIRGAYAFGLARISLGFIFLWAFLDKAFALGFSTGRLEDGTIDFFGRGVAWLNGGSPTEGVLTYATKGPLAGFFQSLSGAAWVDWAYMLSMLLIGVALILGVATRLAAVGGTIWMGVFYVATAIQPEHNPVVDDHVVYALVLVGLAAIGTGRYLGLQERWDRTGHRAQAPGPEVRPEGTRRRGHATHPEGSLGEMMEAGAITPPPSSCGHGSGP